MNLADVQDLYRYNRWANERIAAAVLPLSDDSYTRNLGGSHPSIRDAFAHLIGAEWLWLERMRGASPAARPDWVQSPTAASLVERLREIETARTAYLASLDEEALGRDVPFTLLNGKPGVHRLSDLLLHVVNHSTYHRGQVASMVRAVGVAPPSTDFIAYRAETPFAS